MCQPFTGSLVSQEMMFETGTTTDSERLIMNTLVAQNQCIECNQSHDVRDDPGDGGSDLCEQHICELPKKHDINKSFLV